MLPADVAAGLAVRAATTVLDDWSGAGDDLRGSAVVVGWLALGAGRPTGVMTGCGGRTSTIVTAARAAQAPPPTNHQCARGRRLIAARKRPPDPLRGLAA